MTEVASGSGAGATAPEVASVRDRALGRLVDGGVAIAFAGGVALAAGVMGTLEVPEPRGLLAVAAAPVIIALLGLVALEAIGLVVGGVSLGKALLGLRVVPEPAGALTSLTWAAALVRAVWGLVEVPLFPVALLVMRRSKRHQRWGDRFAGTIVVRAPAGRAGVALVARKDRLGIGLSVAAYLGACGLAAVLLERNEETAVCDQAENTAFRDVCLARVAVAGNKPSLCERSASAAGRDDCYSRVALGLGPAWCERVEAREARDACYMSIAQGDPSVCAKVVDASVQARCILKVAAATHDAKLCESLKTQRDACLLAAGSGATDADPCASRTTSMGRDACYRQKGACDKVESPPGRDQCYLENDKGSGNNCAKIGSPFVQADCLTGAAGSRQDPSLCDTVGASADNPARRHCYDQAFAKTTSASICPRFTDPLTRDDCVFAAATNARSPALCAKIGDAVRKKACGVLAPHGALPPPPQQ